MIILAIDSSGMTASAAIARDNTIIAEYSVNFKKTHSQTLLPMIEEICRMVQLDKMSVDAIAIAGGPGSFTGLRIGSATAKGLGLALGKPLIEVPSLMGMAYQHCMSDHIIAPMMDARRDQVYTALYRFKDGLPDTLAEQTAVPVEEIISKINALGEKVILMGDGADAYADILKEKLAVPFAFAPGHLAYQRAAAVAVCAGYLAERGCMISAADHKPDYLRVSQAERERAERLEKQNAPEDGVR